MTLQHIALVSWKHSSRVYWLVRFSTPLRMWFDWPFWCFSGQLWQWDCFQLFTLSSRDEQWVNELCERCNRQSFTQSTLSITKSKSFDNLPSTLDSHRYKPSFKRWTHSSAALQTIYLIKWARWSTVCNKLSTDSVGHQLVINKST